jgi:hypothetical protein
MTSRKPSENSHRQKPEKKSWADSIKDEIDKLGSYAPWVDDPDEPEEDMTDEELRQLVQGCGTLLRDHEW